MYFCTSVCPCQSIAWIVIFCIGKQHLCIFCMGLSLVRLLVYPVLSAIDNRRSDQPKIGHWIWIWKLFLYGLPHYFLANLHSSQSRSFISLLNTCFLSVTVTNKELELMMYFKISKTCIFPFFTLNDPLVSSMAIA